MGQVRSTWHGQEIDQPPELYELRGFTCPIRRRFHISSCFKSAKLKGWVSQPPSARAWSLRDLPDGLHLKACEGKTLRF